MRHGFRDEVTIVIVTEVIYRVDARGCLTFVNEGWNQFARLNDTPELAGPAVLGRRVADFIAGPETRHIVESLIRRAMTGVDIVLPYRCDSAVLRRRMSLSITRRGTEVEFRSRLIDVQLRPAVPVLDPLQPRSSALLTVCGWCNRGKVGGRWAEIEEVVAELRLLETAVPRLTHGLCGDCQARLLQETAG